MSTRRWVLFVVASRLEMFVGWFDVVVVLVRVGVVRAFLGFGLLCGFACGRVVVSDMVMMFRFGVYTGGLRLFEFALAAVW